MQQYLPRAVVFDMGGTIEEVTPGGAAAERGSRLIVDLLQAEGVISGVVCSSQVLMWIEDGLARYKDWAMEQGVEARPVSIWRDWILSRDGLNSDGLTEAAAERLSFHFEVDCMERSLRPDSVPVLNWLQNAGILMGVISNSISTTQVGYTLDRHNLKSYFRTVQVSAVAGTRKPAPTMFIEAARELGVRPCDCMYVGDSYSRDVVGAKAAGYGWVLWLVDSSGADDPGMKAPDPTGLTWEQRITRLAQIPELIQQAPWLTEKGAVTVGK